MLWQFLTAISFCLYSRNLVLFWCTFLCILVINLYISRSALEGECGFIAANLYAKSIFGEDALVNVSVEKQADGKLGGYIRIRSKTQGIALSLGDKITLKQKGVVWLDWIHIYLFCCLVDFKLFSFRNFAFFCDSFIWKSSRYHPFLHFLFYLEVDKIYLYSLLESFVLTLYLNNNLQLQWLLL